MCIWQKKKQWIAKVAADNDRYYDDFITGEISKWLSKLISTLPPQRKPVSNCVLIRTTQIDGCGALLTVPVVCGFTDCARRSNRLCQFSLQMSPWIVQSSTAKRVAAAQTVARNRFSPSQSYIDILSRNFIDISAHSVLVWERICKQHGGERATRLRKKLDNKIHLLSRCQAVFCN